MSERIRRGIMFVWLAALTAAAVFGRGWGVRRIDELTVQRINVVEPDGTLRLVIANKARFPGTPLKNKEISRPDRDMSGLLYMDNEGTEIGGFTWGGLQKDGKTDSFGHLSFDRYDGDENLSFDTGEKDGKMETSMAINDSWSSSVAMLESERIRSLPAAEQKTAWKKWHQDYPSRTRIVLARLKDQSAMQVMTDPQGRARIILKVAPDGAPSIELLDAEGKVTSRLPKN
ncbi:MAG: hypothetical protein ACHQ2Z_12900 [Elusimicrobiota bacterium]